MVLDEMGGVWLVQPLAVLLVGVVLYALLGWAHVAALPAQEEPRTARVARGQLADELVEAVSRAAAAPSVPRRGGRPSKAPMTAPYATWRSTAWSQGTPRLYVGSPPARIQGWKTSSAATSGQSAAFSAVASANPRAQAGPARRGRAMAA